MELCPVTIKPAVRTMLTLFGSEVGKYVRFSLAIMGVGLLMKVPMDKRRKTLVIECQPGLHHFRINKKSPNCARRNKYRHFSIKTVSFMTALVSYRV